MVYTGDADDRERVLPDLPARRRSLLVRTLERPTRAPARSLLLALCVVAYLTRAAGGRARSRRSLTAPLPRSAGDGRSARYALLYGDRRRRGRRRRARPGRARALAARLLGAYEAPASTHYSVREVAKWLALPRRRARSLRSASSRSRRCSCSSLSWRRLAAPRPAFVAAAVGARPSGSCSRSPTFAYVPTLRGSRSGTCSTSRRSS